MARCASVKKTLFCSWAKLLVAYRYVITQLAWNDYLVLSLKCSSKVLHVLFRHSLITESLLKNASTGLYCVIALPKCQMLWHVVLKCLSFSCRSNIWYYICNIQSSYYTELLYKRSVLGLRSCHLSKIWHTWGAAAIYCQLWTRGPNLQVHGAPQNYILIMMCWLCMS